MTNVHSMIMQFTPKLSKETIFRLFSVWRLVCVCKQSDSAVGGKLSKTTGDYRRKKECCIREKIFHFKWIYFNSYRTQKQTDTNNWKNTKYRPQITSQSDNYIPHTKKLKNSIITNMKMLISQHIYLFYLAFIQLG